MEAAGDIGATFGAMLVGAFVAMAVYGITTLQMYFYYLSFPKDGLEVKLLVATIWILDTIHVALMCHTAHYYLVSGFVNRALLVDGNWSLFTSIAINVLMAFVVQSFFTIRIHKLCPKRLKWWITGIIGFFVVAHFCFGMETVGFFFKKKQFSRLQDVQYQSALPFAITAILSDIFIAAALCFLLESNRSEFEDTNNLINKLVILAINRCVLTSAVAVVEVIVFVSLPHSFYSFGIDFIIGKLYANSLLASLNSRTALRSRREEEPSDVSTSFNLASVASEVRPTTSIIQVPGHETGVNRRIRTVEGSAKDTLTDSSPINKSVHSQSLV